MCGGTGVITEREREKEEEEKRHLEIDIEKEHTRTRMPCLFIFIVIPGKDFCHSLQLRFRKYNKIMSSHSMACKDQWMKYNNIWEGSRTNT